MLKKMSTIHYRYNGKNIDLSALYKSVFKKCGRAKILASVIVELGKEQPVKGKIVFVRNRNKKGQWLAILSTDINMEDDEIVRIYGKRWDIEVFFKMCKSFLNLAKEFQGRS
ncbi:MAG: IS4 family transposase, partial [Magnetococcales bacterium]|nr:IS4 family transposase [Nitrospirota bacterium]